MYELEDNKAWQIVSSILGWVEQLNRMFCVH